MEFKCPHCNRKLRTRDEMLGRRVRCPACANEFTISPGQPATSDVAQTPPTVRSPAAEGARRPCPYCGEQILSAAKKCKHCGEWLQGGPPLPGSSRNGPLGLSLEERRLILQRREWTYLLDFLFIFVVCFVIGLAVGIKAGPYGNSQSAASWLGLLFSIGYCLLKDAFSGKSPGKAITGLRAVDATTGEPIGLSKSVARNWILLVPFFPLVELVVANCREDKRRLGDLMASTVVVRD